MDMITVVLIDTASGAEHSHVFTKTMELPAVIIQKGVELDGLFRETYEHDGFYTRVIDYINYNASTKVIELGLKSPERAEFDESKEELLSGYYSGWAEYRERNKISELASAPATSEEGIILSRSVHSDVVFETRQIARFRELGIETLGDLIDRTAADLLVPHKFGQTSLEDVRRRLRRFSLRLSGDTL